jgi:hypothetical protein
MEKEISLGGKIQGQEDIPLIKVDGLFAKSAPTS